MTIGRIPSVEGGIQPTIVDAKGDLIVGLAADSVGRLAIGTNDYVLTAASGETAGMKWAAVPAAGSNWSLVNTGGTALTGAATITVSGISGKDKIMVLIDDASGPASSRIGVRLNTNTGSVYYCYGIYESSSVIDSAGGPLTYIYTGSMSNQNASKVSGGVTLTGCNSNGVKQFVSLGAGSPEGSTNQEADFFQGYVNISDTISSVSLFCDSGNFDAGTLFVYASA